MLSSLRLALVAVYSPANIEEIIYAEAKSNSILLVINSEYSFEMEHQNEMPANPTRVYTQTAGRTPPTIPVSYTYHWPVGRQRPAHESRSHIGVAQSAHGFSPLGF
jgi:hypothetical protein